MAGFFFRPANAVTRPGRAMIEANPVTMQLSTPRCAHERARRNAKDPRSGGSFAGGQVVRYTYMRSIIAFPKPEHDTCVAPGISRAKS